MRAWMRHGRRRRGRSIRAPAARDAPALSATRRRRDGSPPRRRPGGAVGDSMRRADQLAELGRPTRPRPCRRRRAAFPVVASAGRRASPRRAGRPALPVGPARRRSTAGSRAALTRRTFDQPGKQLLGRLVQRLLAAGLKALDEAFGPVFVARPVFADPGPRCLAHRGAVLAHPALDQGAAQSAGGARHQIAARKREFVQAKSLTKRGRFRWGESGARLVGGCDPGRCKAREPETRRPARPIPAGVLPSVSGSSGSSTQRPKGGAAVMQAAPRARGSAPRSSAFARNAASRPGRRRALPSGRGLAGVSIGRRQQQDAQPGRRRFDPGRAAPTVRVGQVEEHAAAAAAGQARRRDRRADWWCAGLGACAWPPP